jgi:hypothetical protein
VEQQNKEDYKNRKNQAAIFGGNLRPNCTSLCQKMEKQMQIQGQIK